MSETFKTEKMSYFVTEDGVNFKQPRLLFEQNVQRHHLRYWLIPHQEYVPCDEYKIVAALDWRFDSYFMLFDTRESQLIYHRLGDLFGAAYWSGFRNSDVSQFAMCPELSCAFRRTLRFCFRICNGQFVTRIFTEKILQGIKEVWKQGKIYHRVLYLKRNLIDMTEVSYLIQ